MVKKKPGKKKHSKRTGNASALKRGQNMMRAGWAMVHAGEAKDITAALRFLSSEVKYAGNPKAKKAKKAKKAPGKKRAAPKGAAARMAKARALYLSGAAPSTSAALEMIAGSRSLLY